MPRYSKQSLERLETCEDAIQRLFNAFILEFDCTILCGHRTASEQSIVFAAGHSRCEWPDSEHNNFPSTAIDVAPYYIEKPHTRWDKGALYRWYYFGGRVIQLASKMNIPIRWGGDWDMDTYVKDQRFNDLPHFELIL